MENLDMQLPLFSKETPDRPKQRDQVVATEIIFGKFDSVKNYTM
jgi:hypothetical protein